MAIQTRATLKSWFETGDYPTQQQFADAWDSFWHKEENINGANVIIGGDTLIDFLNMYFWEVYPAVTSYTSSTGTIAVAARQTIRRLCFLADVAQTVKIGTTVGADDVATVDLQANEIYWLDINWVNQTTGTVNLHLSGMATRCDIAVYSNHSPFGR